MAKLRENVTGRALPDPALVSHHAIVMAERQGFDDGYFHGQRQLDFSSQAERIACDTEFGRGVEQRARADAFANEPAVQRRRRK